MKSNASQLDKAKKITRLVILINVGIAIGLFTLFWWIGFNTIISAILAFIGWPLVVLRTSVFDWFVINVISNWVVILGNRLEYDKVPDKPTTIAPGEKDPRTKMYELASLREVGPGYNGKFPWEIPFESVDLRSEVIIGNGNSADKPLTCYTLDNITVEVIWQVVLTPLRGHCCNLVRKGEEATQAFFRGEFEQAIINWVKTEYEKDLAGKLTHLKEAFRNVFGGPDKISEAEENYGVFTNTPQIISIKRSAAYQKAAEATQVGERMAEVIATIRHALGADADINMILAAAAAITGNNIEGLLLIPGLAGNPDAMASVLAAAGTLGIKAGKGGKKGTP